MTLSMKVTTVRNSTHSKKVLNLLALMHQDLIKKLQISEKLLSQEFNEFYMFDLEFSTSRYD